MNPGPLKIAHVTPSYWPAFVYGGPTESSHQLSRYLARGGAEVRVLTTDANGPTEVVDVETERALDFEPRLSVRYCARRLPDSVAPTLLAQLPAYVGWCDVVHLNAVYNFTTLPTLAACALLGKPVVWTARGALQRWERVRRARPKAVWEQICRLIAPRRTVIHVTSESEREQTAARMRGMRVALIPNGVEIPEPAPRPPRGETLKLLCFGRIHPIKGIENLLAACAELVRRGDGAFTLTLAGRGEADYEGSIRKAIADLDLGSRVAMVGAIGPEGKAALFGAADLLVAPSFTENFGLAIVEALSHGVPVIAGRGTPWQRLEAEGAGLWVDNDGASLAEAIARARALPLRDLGDRGRAWMEREFGWPRVAAEMTALYEEIRKTPR